MKSAAECQRALLIGEANRLTMQQRQFQLCKLLLGHGNAHLAVCVFAVLDTSASRHDTVCVLLVLALYECLEYRCNTVVYETVQTFVHSAAACSRASGGGRS